jgi:tripartite-type tricarboxylate transporter receptor subunit TctC
MSFGVPVQYLMMRGVFMAGGATPAQVAYYQGVLDRVRALPEWRTLMRQGAFKDTTMDGPPFVSWLDRAESFHRVLMREARLTPGSMVTLTGSGGPTAPASAPRR